MFLRRFVNSDANNTNDSRRSDRRNSLAITSPSEADNRTNENGVNSPRPDSQLYASGRPQKLHRRDSQIREQQQYVQASGERQRTHSQRPISYTPSRSNSTPYEQMNSYDYGPSPARPQQQLHSRLSAPSPPRPIFVPVELSQHSTPTVPDSLWFGGDVQLGAGVVIIQPATEKIVVVSEKRQIKVGGGKVDWEYYFLPKGRKDVGEAMEEAALREGYEESGYRCSFLPLNIPTRCPVPPGPDGRPSRPRFPNTEPIYITTQHNPSRHSHTGTEYITFWYVAQIPEDAVREEGTGMEDEKNYVSHLLSIEEALTKLKDSPVEYRVVRMAWMLWRSWLEEENKKEMDRIALERQAREAREMEAEDEESTPKTSQRPGPSNIDPNGPAQPWKWTNSPVTNGNANGSQTSLVKRNGIMSTSRPSTGSREAENGVRDGNANGSGRDSRASTRRAPIPRSHPDARTSFENLDG